MPDKPKLTEKKLLIELCTRTEAIEKNSKQQFFALLGVIMALVGQKLISTPWYIDTAVIMALFVGGFLGASLFWWWKRFSWPQRCVRVFGTCLMIGSAVSQIWIYHPGEEAAPYWFPVMTNVLMIMLALSLFWAGITQKPAKPHILDCNL